MRNNFQVRKLATKKTRTENKNQKKLIKIHREYKASSKRNRLLGNIFGLIAIIITFLLGASMINKVSNIKIDLSILWWFYEEVKEGPKEVLNWKTNILIIWRWGTTHHEAPDLTDTIILASINFDKKSVSMLSIPRDLYVEYPMWWAGKINETYFRAKRKYDDNDKAMEELEKVITNITWEEINYYVNVDFKAFIKIVDTVWGIEIDVPENLYDNEYPGEKYYTVFSIKKWLQTLDWETALKYARSRHSTSDFDRSLRQQLIISALKEKIVSQWYLKNISQARWLYLALKENIDTDLSIAEMLSLAIFAKDIPNDRILSFNLNDTCWYATLKCDPGWLLYAPVRIYFNNMSVFIPNTATVNDVSNYDDVQKYANLIFNYPDVYIEKPKITIYNSTKVWQLASEYAKALKKYGFNVDEKSVGSIKDEIYEKSKIFFNDIKESSDSIQALKLFIFGGSEEKDTPVYSTDQDVRIEIIIWKDYNNLVY